MPVSRRQLLKLISAVPASIVLTQFSSSAFADAPKEDAPRDSGFATNPVLATELATGLSLLSGPGGNITLLNAADGPIMIDSGIEPRGEDVLAALKIIVGGAAPLTLVNTHWHADHTGGNAAIAKAGTSAIVAHENTFARLSTTQHIAFFGMDIPAAPQIARPTVTFPDSLMIRRVDEQLRLVHFDPAHTDSDIAIFFKQANVAVAGDLFFNGFYPFIDYSTGGSLDGMIAANTRLLTMVDDKTKIVPGHGPVGRKADLVKFGEMLKTVKDRLAPLISAGTSLDDLQAKRPLADLDEMWGNHTFHGSNFIHIVYAGETAKH